MSSWNFYVMLMALPLQTKASWILFFLAIVVNTKNRIAFLTPFSWYFKSLDYTDGVLLNTISFISRICIISLSMTCTRALYFVSVLLDLIKLSMNLYSVYDTIAFFMLVWSSPTRVVYFEYISELKFLKTPINIVDDANYSAELHCEAYSSLPSSLLHVLLKLQMKHSV